MNAILLADRFHRNFHASDFFSVYSDYVMEQLQAIEGLEVNPAPVYYDELDRRLETARGAEIIFSNWGMPEMSQEEVDRYFPNVRAIFYAGSSVKVFAEPFFARQVRIFSAGEANAASAAEFTLAQILLANKSYLQAMRAYRGREGYAQGRDLAGMRPGNYQARVGLLGIGRVGSRVAQLLAPFDIVVLGCDPYLEPNRAQALGIAIADMEEIFATCDTICSHLPHTAQTERMLGYGLFSLMGPCATFINAALGEAVDEPGLVRAMREVPTRTAILDSVLTEPIAEDHPFLSLPNVFLSPHIAGSFGGEVERMGELLVQCCQDYFRGKESPHELKPDMLSIRC